MVRGSRIVKTHGKVRSSQINLRFLLYTHQHANNLNKRYPRGEFFVFISSISIGQKSFPCYHYLFPEGDEETNAAFLFFVKHSINDMIVVIKMRWGLQLITQQELIQQRIAMRKYESSSSMSYCISSNKHTSIHHQR